MQLSVVAHALSAAADLRAVAERARALGFDGLVIEPAAFPAVVDPSRTAQREIVHVLSRAGQPPVAIEVRLEPNGVSPSARGDVDRAIARITRAIDIARGLATSLVLCDLGPLPPAPDEPAPPKPAITKAALGGLILPDPPAAPVVVSPALPREPAFEDAVDHLLREVGQQADRAGCMVAFRASLGSFASLEAALRRVDCPFFGIDLDPLALVADTWSLDTFFSRLGQLARHVRGRDGLRAAATGRVMAAEIGAGQVNWPELLAALRDSDYRGAITLDPAELSTRPAEAATRGLARLRGWHAADG